MPKTLIIIPESELKITASRSSGPGGQNVNKVSTKAEVRWMIQESPSFSDEQKERIISYVTTHAPKNIVGENEILFTDSTTRSFFQNKEAAINKLSLLVTKALTPKKKRIPTKKPKSANEKRLKEKKLAGEKKRNRKGSEG